MIYGEHILKIQRDFNLGALEKSDANGIRRFDLRMFYNCIVTNMKFNIKDVKLRLGTYDSQVGNIMICEWMEVERFNAFEFHFGQQSPSDVLFLEMQCPEKIEETTYVDFEAIFFLFKKGRR